MAEKELDVAKVIAKAIKRADTRYFFENYSRQADAVLEALEQKGFLVVPADPSEPMVDAGIEALSYGRVNKFHQIRDIYRMMVRQPAHRPRAYKPTGRRIDGPGET